MTKRYIPSMEHHSTEKEPSVDRRQPSTTTTRILLLVGDQIGANCISGGRKLSILDKFARFGWNTTLAGTATKVSPCSFAAKRGAKPLSLDCLVEDIADIRAFDAISILPGPSHNALSQSKAAISLIRDAFAAGLIMSGWCHGVRVLAAAGVVDGRRVVCHSDDREVIENAGGKFVGHDHPPVIDGNLVTCARSYYYRAKNAEAIRSAIRARAPL